MFKKNHPSRLKASLIQILVICSISCMFSFHVGVVVGSNFFSCDCDTAKSDKTSKTSNHNEIELFPNSINDLFYGAARVDRDAFTSQFDLGVPLDRTTRGNSQALLLYSSEGAMPSSVTKNATENCNVLKIILTQPNQHRHCLALVGQWESYHIHKWMRLPPDNQGGINPDWPLRPVARTYNERKGKAQLIPRKHNVDRYEKILVRYLSTLKDTLEKLKPIAESVAGEDLTIVVLTCNFGQAELLLNFLCNYRSFGFKKSQILVFPTDLKTKELVDSMGDIATFYDETNFQEMPEDSAGKYGDNKFKGMMMAKVFCVHWVVSLGYNVLFQDVDVIWFNNPLKFLENRDDGFDLYFQDDGSQQPRYAPYSPNTGFYYVRASEKTQYFFSQLVRQADTIVQSGSHQSALSAVLNEHVSYRGLRVKTFQARDKNCPFPGGFHYHSGISFKPYMKELMSNPRRQNVASIFHMSWTENSVNKKIFLQQMGQWYVEDNCSGKTVDEIGEATTACCRAEPLFQCHYRDKPSKESCKNSEPIDSGHPSWW
eukprot:CAMPEP_0194223600 /NCGR_PEP_ID=MMETSP0156-20130528/35539_1 /TAXON_ID=33649 /ORGANISM="Thalassionema nitzschioides, Strain L26-B" /LENGTH=541 /DNA_ID=CAMNT_0038954813 /DNA_START=1 /DNA_END=1626 /DNA_ORIENTATION=-